MKAPTHDKRSSTFKCLIIANYRFANYKTAIVCCMWFLMNVYSVSQISDYWFNTRK